MKESHDEGLASHIGPESCIVAREGEGEALTGESAGQVLSREMREPLRGADAVERSGRPDRARRQRKTRPDPARSETLGMHGHTLRGNREIPPPSRPPGRYRIGKSKDVRRGCTVMGSRTAP